MGGGKNYQISYDVKKIGEKVRFTRKKGYINLNIEGSMNNKVMVAVRLDNLLAIQKISFFTETGNVILMQNQQTDTEGYTILSTIQLMPMMQNLSKKLNVNDLQIAKRFLRNQVVNSKKDYHFGTTGNIYSFGFGQNIPPMWKLNIRLKKLKKMSNIFFQIPYLCLHVKRSSQETYL